MRTNGEKRWEFTLFISTQKRVFDVTIVYRHLVASEYKNTELLSFLRMAVLANRLSGINIRLGCTQSTLIWKPNKGKSPRLASITHCKVMFLYKGLGSWYIEIIFGGISKKMKNFVINANIKIIWKVLCVVQISFCRFSVCMYGRQGS